MNETTYWDQIQEYHSADVMLQIVRRILGPREKFGRGRRILIHKNGT